MKEKEKKEAKKIKLRTIKNEKDIAFDFATKVHQRFGILIKATVLFGSQAKNTATPNSDIDIIIIVDDSSIKWDLELVAWYREEISKLISKEDYRRDLHITTVKLTTWWNDLINGDPVVINILRYGEVLIDSGGFFEPLKALLFQGKIHSTPEAVYAALQRAPVHILRSKNAVLGAIEGLFWAMVDSAQAALMTAGKLPPSTEQIPRMLKEEFVDSGIMKNDFVISMRDLYNLHKSISYGDIRFIKGSLIDQWQKTTEEFLLEMTRIVNYLIEKNKS